MISKQIANSKIITDKIVHTSMPIALLEFQAKVLDGWKLYAKDAFSLVGVVYTINIYKEDNTTTKVADIPVSAKLNTHVETGDNIREISPGNVNSTYTVVDIPAPKPTKPRKPKGDDI